MSEAAVATTRQTAFRRGAARPRGKYLVAVLVSIPFWLPFVWLVVNVLKPVDQFYAAPPTLFPNPPTLDSITTAFNLLDTPRLIANSLLVAVSSVVLTVLSSAVVGFAFAALPARGREWLFAVLVATILLPPIATLVPQFILFSRLGWVGSYLPLIVPHLFGTAFYIFLFRQWFLTLPANIYDSAALDGANPLQTFWYIALPLSLPAVAAVAVFAFLAAWNDFLAPLIYLRNPDSFTLSVAMATIEGMYARQPHLAVAMALIALVPPVIVFFLAQRYLSGSVASAGWRAS